jgi:hypothetical protein
MSLAGHTESKRKIRNIYSVLIEKSEWKTPLGRPRLRYEDNSETDLEEMREKI